MRKLSIILSLFLSFTLTGLASSNPVVKETTNGEIIKVEIIVSGALELYQHNIETTAHDIEAQQGQYVQKECLYFLGQDETGTIRKLTVFNYKQILKKALSDNPGLADKIGTKGYRFKDLEKILNEHNC